MTIAIRVSRRVVNHSETAFKSLEFTLKVFLLGTNHAPQYLGYKDSFSSEFANYVNDIVKTFGIDLIAEEMNEEALEKEARESTARTVALSTGVKHALCDPDNSERIALKIPSEEQLKTKLGIGRAMLANQVTELDNATREFWPIREQEWLRRLKCIESKKCLFILGTEHVQSFTELLSSREVASEVLCQKWRPGKIVGS